MPVGIPAGALALYMVSPPSIFPSYFCGHSPSLLLSFIYFLVPVHTIDSLIPGLSVSAHSASYSILWGLPIPGSLSTPHSPLAPPPTQDPHLDKFFTLVHVLEEGAFPFRLKDGVLSEGTVEQELRASLAALRLTSPEPLVAFSHHVLDKLVRLVVRPPIIGGQIGE